MEKESISSLHFQMKQVLAMIESNLVANSNSSEFQFFLDLKEELTEKIKVMEGK